MNTAQTLVLIYEHFDSKELIKSGEIWNKEGWIWDYREKTNRTIITLCVRETLKNTDERLKVAGVAPLKIIKLWDENDAELGVRQKPFFTRDIENSLKLKKVKRDLIEEFNEVTNSTEKTAKKDSEPINESVLKPYNRTEPKRLSQKLTFSEEESQIIHTNILFCDKKPIINIKNI